MSWPVCLRCRSDRIESNGPGYLASETSVKVYRSHKCLDCGWRAWSCEEICTEDPPVQTIRARIGGFRKADALRPFQKGGNQPDDLQGLLFEGW